MSGKELYDKYKNMEFEEVNRIAHDPDSSFDEIIAASIVITDKEIEDGDYYTMEEVFGKKVSDSYR